MLHLNVVNLGHEARRISYFHIFCVLEAGTNLENQKWKAHPYICCKVLVSGKKNNTNFKEDIRLVESCRFSCRLIQQKG